MSRTFRKKKIPNRPNNQEWRCFQDCVLNKETYRFVYKPVDKLTDPKRWRIKRWQLHRESSSANERTPGRLYRQVRQRELRSIAKQELFRFTIDYDYEVMIPEQPQNHMWDWR